MAKVSLRAYNREIESMIEQGQRLDEAVAHCRHILASFPKHLDTYRLLGKSYLEAKQYDQAVDIFQRVLVAAPEDFVAHVGMSIIADDQGKLDDAIWHMERAFEVQPSNAAIQAELQRLFGRRDGVEPPKIRLTRGALAHMYVQGELYTQAISEIRAVLAADGARTDMQVLLARAYFQSGQKAAAAEACSALLANAPYCLDANRLMAEILPGAQAAEAAKEHRRRVIELDPYAEFARGSAFTSEDAPDSTVTLERLEYTGLQASPAFVSPTSVSSLSTASEMPEPTPSWLSSAPAKTAPVSDEPGEEADLPEFLRESGWREVPADESGEASPLPEAEQFDEQAVPGQLPEWVRALAPEDSPHAAMSETSNPSDELEPAGLKDDSFGETAGDETPDWLRDLAGGVSDQPESSPAVPDTAASTAEVPSNGERSPLPSPATDDSMAWLEGLTGMPEDAAMEPRASNQDYTRRAPDALERLPTAETTGLNGWEPLRQEQAGDIESPALTGKDSGEQTSSGSLDWLTGLADSNAFSAMERSEEPELQAGPGDDQTRGTETADDSLPDWLSARQGGPEPEQAAPRRESSGEYESGVALPDWLSDMDADRRAETPLTRSEGEDSMPTPPGTAVPAGADKGELSWDSIDSSAQTTATPESHAAPSNRPAPEATPAKTQAAAARPTPASASLSTAKAELGRGNIGAALDMYSKLIRKGKSLEEIIRDLRDALYRYPVEVPIWQALGDAYMRANRLQDALDAYTKAEELLR